MLDGGPEVLLGWREVACPSCGSAESSPQFEAHNLRYGIDVSSTIVRCASCGLLRTDPQPDADASAKLYPAGAYYTHGDAASSASHLAMLCRRAQAWLRGRWRASMVTGPLSRVRLKIEARSDVRRFSSRYALDVLDLQKGVRVLDIGCGDGKLISSLQRSGLRCFGVEIDPVARRVAEQRGLSVVAAIEEVEGSFDRLIMSHVLEHLTEPLGMLRSATDLLDRNGLLLISVPNAESRQAEVFGHFWEGWDVPRHRWHFTADSLRAMVETAGLDVVALRSVEVDGFAEASEEHRRQHGESPVCYEPVDYPDLEQRMEGTELVLVATPVQSS